MITRNNFGMNGWMKAGWLAVLLAGASLNAPAADALPKGITTETYLMWGGSLAVEADEAEAKLVIVPAIGGRIMRYEVMGDNILWDNPATYGLTTATTKRTLLPGGYQMQVVVDKSLLPTDRLEYGPYEVVKTRDYTVTLANEKDPVTGLRLEKEILLEPQTGEVGVTQRLQNDSGRELSCSIRSRTQCKGGGFVLIPLNKYTRFRAGWTLRHEVEGKAIYDRLNPASPQVKLMANVLVAETKGLDARIGTDSDAEWVAYIHDRVMFVQYFPYDFKAKYPDGHTIEVGWNDFWTELELVGPQITLTNGGTSSMLVKWTMIELQENVTTAKQARALVSKVPPSPFKPSKK
jgi:hypothetical protein